ncbi:MAG: uracil-DNA glycosylase [Candidatus Saccharimonadales bacterium]
MKQALTKQAKLDQIRADILDLNICEGLRQNATQLVFGDGSADSEIVFIGEAPGKSEDEQGLPFVGAAGKFLNEMLASIGLERSEVYITNIVKYRPPANRDPLPEEKAAFLPYLRQQIMVIQPKLIVTLGRHSLETLIPGLRISECHGRPKRVKIPVGRQGASTMQGAGEQRTELYKNVTAKEQTQPATPQRAANDGGVGGSADEQAIMSLVILPLFHPAAALYNGSMRQTLINDFAKIPKVLEQINNPKPAISKSKESKYVASNR